MNPLNPPVTFEPPFANEGEGPAASAQPTASSMIAQIDEANRAATDADGASRKHEVVQEKIHEKLAQYYKADMTLQFALALAPHVVAERLHNSATENQAKLLWSMAEAMASGAPAWVVEGINSVG